VAFSPRHYAADALAPACQRLPPHSIVYLRHLPKMGAELSTPIEIESSSILHPSFDSAPWWLFKPRPHLTAPHFDPHSSNYSLTLSSLPPETLSSARARGFGESVIVSSP
jgi:hypothetical protein